MRFPKSRAVAIALGLGGLTLPLPAPAAETDKSLLSDAKHHFQVLPAVSAQELSSDKARLGRQLFFESRISADGNVSCSHCHQPALYGTDGLAKSVGVFGKPNARNAPTVFNAALQFKQHWRGDRESLEDQAEKSLLGPASFGNPDYTVVLAKLKSVPGYSDLFAKAFPEDKDPINQKNLASALSAYQRTLLTPSRFDAFLAGKANALTPLEKTGVRNFIDVGCSSCRNGVDVGGDSFQKFGMVEDYWKETASPQPDKGRADVTKNDGDLYFFKVPSLRNVAKTAPYFHDGSVAELPRAVKIMAKVQLGKELSDKDVEAITAFLSSLTGSIPANFSAPEPFPDIPSAKGTQKPQN